MCQAPKPVITKNMDDQPKKVKEHVCHICKISFAFPKNLERHIKLKHDFQPLQCQVPGCSEMFFGVRAVRSHMKKVHPVAKTFKCKPCSMEFKRQEHYAAHMSQHEKFKKHICTECDKKFHSISDRNRHVDVVHRKVHQCICNVCGKVLSSKDSLRNHMRAVHQQGEGMKCDYCDNFFYHRSSLRKHLASEHGMTT